ncbi:MAG TPA: hypothetical protein PLB21_10110, partial [Actinomycetota bacterium]|nr:hypothetical protein [Actinomycetota bacterium]
MTEREPDEMPTGDEPVADQPAGADGPAADGAERGDRPQPGPEPLPGWSRQQPPPFVPPEQAEAPPTPSTPQPAGAPTADAQPPDAQTPAGHSPEGPPPATSRGPSWAPPPPAPTPGIIALRPLTVGEMMSGAIDYVRRDPGTVIAISAIIGLAAALAQIIFLGFSYSRVQQFPTEPSATISPDELLRMLTTLGAIALATAAVAGVLQVLGTGMLSHVMGRAVIGQRTDLRQAWTMVRPQIWRLVGATVLVAVAVSLAIVLPLLPGIGLLLAGLPEAGAVALLPGLGLSVVAGVWVSFTLVLSTPALALEDCGALTSLKRSRKLVAGAFWRTLGIVLLGSIV